MRKGRSMWSRIEVYQDAKTNVKNGKEGSVV